jgi:transcription elongation factor Elf1
MHNEARVRQGIMDEYFICLFCNKQLKGDQEWLDHRLSTEHAVATIVRDAREAMGEKIVDSNGEQL